MDEKALRQTPVEVQDPGTDDLDSLVLSLDEILERAQLERPAELSGERVAIALRAIAW